MNVPIRSVEPEVLDGLDAHDPRARRARRDLQRVHAAMRSVSILVQAVARLGREPPRRILELGAGDGTLLLRFARAIRPRWKAVALTLLDRVDVVSDETREAYRQLDWEVTVLTADAVEWASNPPAGRYDLCLTSLFLHHFQSAELGRLLRAVAETSDAFVACEPRRSTFSLLGSRLVALLGANAVTREDAVTSVAAGFAGEELTSAWGTSGGDWRLEEYAALPFTHCFTAARAAPRSTLGAPEEKTRG